MTKVWNNLYLYYQNEVPSAFKWTVGITLFLHLLLLIQKVGVNPVYQLSNLDEEVIKLRLVPNTKPKKEKLQVVDTEKRKQVTKSQDTRFLSEKDQAVDRQTVARHVAKFNTAGKGIKNGHLKASKSMTKSKKNVKKKISLSDLRVKKAKNVLKELGGAASPAALGLKTGSVKSKGLSSSNDFVEEIPLGDFTQLNTTEFKYYGFYHRIKQKLEQFWGLNIKDKVSSLYRQGRRLPAGENHITSLKITLDKKGKIIDVKIKSTSGFRELDDAAIESFNNAGPFPNPPKGMIKNGIATIEWGFVVKS
jgi:TonB family protein